MTRVVVLLQQNKTTDFYFPTLASWGAVVKTGGTLLTTPPDFDQSHDRSAWVHYKMGDYPAVDLQIDNDTVIPYYSWLAKQFTFCDHHFAVGSDSTSGHMLAVGGQTPTLRNPPRSPARQPVWDLPTIFKHAERQGISWAAFTENGKYPVHYYTELADAASQANIHAAGDFLTMAATGTLPDVCYVWSPAGYDEHPPDAGPDPQYIQKGHDLTWQRVDAVVKAGGWTDTVFILTWDDWGGYTDSVPTLDAETVPDALHPGGFQVIGGSRIPLLMFGGHVKQGIESNWHSHASILKTVIDLLGLPAFGVPRVDSAPSLAGRVDPALSRPQPPAFGTAIVQPSPPVPTPTPVPPLPWGGPNAQPMPPLVARHGATIPVPTDGTVSRRSPKPPAQAGAGSSAKPPRGKRPPHPIGTPATDRRRHQP